MNCDILKIVRGNDFATQMTITALDAGGNVIENFSLEDSTDVVVKYTLAGSSHTIEAYDYDIEGNDITIQWSDLSLGKYGFDIEGKFNGYSWRFAARFIFQIVADNASANIPDGVLVDGVYKLNDWLRLLSGTGGGIKQVQADWTETDTNSPAYIQNKPDFKTINGESILGEGNIEVGGDVESVNGKTGEVVLDAEDVGAASAEDLQDVADDVATLQAAYEGLTQTDIIVGALPESGVANTIYRVPSTSSFSDYMWYGGEFVLLATYSLGLKPIDIALLNKILKNGVYVQNVDGDIEDLVDSLSGEQTISVVAPSISVNDDFEVSITNEDLSDNISLYYTLDDSTPTAESTEYTTPFKSQYDCTIKAIAVNSNDEVSRVSSVEYTAGAVEYIDFADKTVLEPLVVALADTSGDGKVTPAEAGLVANIGTTFKGKAITSFEELNFFTGITELKYQSFSGCSSLKTIRVPKNVTKIDNQSFQGCTDLEMIYLPDTITTMCSCFGGATGTHNTKLKIAGKKLPSSLNSFSGYYADDLRFTDCAELELDELPPHLPKISTYMFSGCSKLALTSLPSEITSIGDFAFNGCSKLAITEIPASVSGSIAGSTFKSCSSLVSLNIKGSITGITGDYAFQYCSNLEEIIFPETMTTWSGMFTFNGCTKLTKIVLKSPSVVALSRVSDDTIGGNSNIYVPSNLVASYLADAKWSTINNASNRIKAIEE